MPAFLKDVLQQLDWSDGTFIPISNEQNKELEAILNARTKELEKLREENDIHLVLQNEVDSHLKNIQSEHKENMQLLAVHREQIRNEDHYDNLTSSEISRFIQDINVIYKQCKEIRGRSENVQGNISQILRRVEFLRCTLGGEQSSLDEWQAALKRSETDIKTFMSFNKQDTSQINDLEIKRQNLKREHDKKHSALSNLCGNIFAEEKSAERTSDQVVEALSNRRRIVSTWANAVENLRQRNKKIQQIKKELKMLREFANSRSDLIREKEEFLNIQMSNNNEVERELMEFNGLLSNQNRQLISRQEMVKSLDSQLICAKKELINTSNELLDYRMYNKRCVREIIKKKNNIDETSQQIISYKEKLSEVIDGSKSAAQRIKQLEDMLNNEEKYIKQIIMENEREQNHIVHSQQQLFKLKEDENNCIIEIRACKASIMQIEAMQIKAQKDLSLNKENIYNLCYQLDVASSRLQKLEGECEDSKDYEMLKERANQLTIVSKERSVNSQHLASQIIKVDGDLRLLIRTLSLNQMEKETLQNRLNAISANAEGAVREECCLRKNARNRRAEETYLQLRIKSLEESLKRLYHKEDSLSRAHLDLHAAVKEREAEVIERLNVLIAQKRVLQKEKANIAMDIKMKQNKIEQLKNRYDIYISALGKNEDGETFSVAYFKIKYAQEKSELQQEGDMLDAQIRKGEEEIAALEATLQVVDAANKKFVRNLDAIKDDDPEMLEYNNLCSDYDSMRLVRSEVVIHARRIAKEIENSHQKITELVQEINNLQIIRDDLIDELSIIKKELKEQLNKLNRANDLRKKSGKSVKRKIKSSEIWVIHEKDIYTKVISEANHSAGAQLGAINSQFIEKYADELDLNITQVNSAPLVTRSKWSHSSRSSLLSDSWIQQSTRSDLSISGEESQFDTLEEQSYMNQSQRRESDIQNKVKNIKQRSHHKGASASDSNMMPLNVVVLGIDDESQSKGVFKLDVEQKSTSKGKELKKTASVLSKSSKSSNIKKNK